MGTENQQDKIYRRSTQSGGTPPKKKNEKNRVRNTSLNFRMSPRERELIEARIKLSGMPKGEFFIQSCLYQAILVKGNVKTFDAIRKEMKAIDEHLRQIDTAADLDEKLLLELRTILEILDSVFKKEK